MPTANPINTVGPCEFHDHLSFAIDPEGVIYKCPGFLGHPEWGIGHVSRGVDQAPYERLLRATPQGSCDGCSHRPNCGGGCVAAEWLKTGKPEGVNCDKPYFERVKEEAVIRSSSGVDSDYRVGYRVNDAVHCHNHMFGFHFLGTWTNAQHVRLRLRNTSTPGVYHDYNDNAGLIVMEAA